jgi:hemerythrin-like domain-containing protein
MPQTSPAGPLLHEHRLIERMLAVMTRKLETAERVGAIDPLFVDTATDFIRTYADACHHGKEEDILFRRLASKDLDPGLAQAMADLIEDHLRGRSLTRRLVEANKCYADGDRSALPDIEADLRALIEFYPVHIDKEDHHFFKPALAYFTEKEQADMLAAFTAFDSPTIHDRYLAIVERLERAVG